MTALPVPANPPRRRPERDGLRRAIEALRGVEAVLIARDLECAVRLTDAIDTLVETIRRDARQGDSAPLPIACPACRAHLHLTERGGCVTLEGVS